MACSVANGARDANLTSHNCASASDETTLEPVAMARFDGAVDRGVPARDAMRLAAKEMTHIPISPDYAVLTLTARMS
jgi:hypothetical protein